MNNHVIFDVDFGTAEESADMADRIEYRFPYLRCEVVHVPNGNPLLIVMHDGTFSGRNKAKAYSWQVMEFMERYQG